MDHVGSLHPNVQMIAGETLGAMQLKQFLRGISFGANCFSSPKRDELIQNKRNPSYVELRNLTWTASLEMMLPRLPIALINVKI
jgi:hypothetical protein